MIEPNIVVADPTEVAARRITDQGIDWIALDFAFEYEGDEQKLRVALRSQEFMVLLTAALLALGYPESDTDYLLERFDRDFR